MRTDTNGGVVDLSPVRGQTSTYNSDNSAVVVRIIAGIDLSDKCQGSEEESNPTEQTQPQGQGAP